MDVLVVGKGGREHAIAAKLAEEIDGTVFVTERNDGVLEIAESIPITPHDTEKLLHFARQNVDVTVIGPEAPQKGGIVDRFREARQLIFGANQAAAELESSKQWAKQVMVEEGIPTAQHASFNEYSNALEHARSRSLPMVVKADGNASARGVEICSTLEKAEAVIGSMMLERILNEAGSTVVIEDYLEGYEVSLHAWSDGSTRHMFPLSQDHKYSHDNEEGSLTGSMGTVAPLPSMSYADAESLGSRFIDPIHRAFRAKGISDKGLLYYPGLMLTADGPKALEYNMRFGDTEAQVYMRLLKSRFLDMVMACLEGTLAENKAVWSQEYAVCVVMASGGYPDSKKYKVGYPIDGLEEASALEGVKIYHAGTTYNRQGRLLTNGGRVLNVTALGETLEEAIARAYRAVGLIDFQDKHFRRDIGRKALSMGEVVLL